MEAGENRNDNQIQEEIPPRYMDSSGHEDDNSQEEVGVNDIELQIVGDNGNDF